MKKEKEKIKMHEKPFFYRDMTEEQREKQKSGFAERLQQIRKRKKESQESVSKALGLGNCTYGTYENDKFLPDVYTLCKLAKHFDVSADYLLGLVDEPNHAEKELPMFQNFFEEYKYDMERVRADTNSEKIFKYLLQEKEFVDFLFYIHTYLVYSAKFSREEKKRLQENPMYDEAVCLDVSQTSVDTKALPGKGIAVEDVYMHLLHEKLNDLLRNIARENGAEFKATLKRKVENYIVEQKEKQ